MGKDENNKLTLGVPPAEGTSLAERRKIGGSKLHQRVAAAPLATQPSVQNPLMQPVAAKQNPFDASLEMPNRIGMMLDCSSSMCSTEGSKSKIQHLKDACLDFLHSCDFSNTAAVVETFPGAREYGEDEDKDLYMVRSNPNDPLAHLLPQAPTAPKRKRGAKRGLCNIEAFLQADIDSLRACGGTPMAGAMDRCITQNSLTRGIIVSDGEADSSESALASAKNYWREAGIPIDTVHIGRSTEGEHLLKQIAELTGGMYIKFDNVANFAKNFKFLSPALRYMLTSGSANMLGAKEVK